MSHFVRILKNKNNNKNQNGLDQSTSKLYSTLFIYMFIYCKSLKLYLYKIFDSYDEYDIINPHYVL